MRAVYEDAQVQVVSDGPMSESRARALAARVEAAYEYDKRVQQWRDERPLDAQLTVAVLSREAFSRVTGDSSGSIGGVTTGPDLFIVPDTVAGRGTSQAEDTLAHELGHVQDLRQAGPRIAAVPVYLQEGKEYLLGDRYPLARGMRNPHLAYVAEHLGALTAEVAQAVMTHFRDPSAEGAGPFGFIGEVTGSLFVEFLRTRLEGKGLPDAVARVADTISAVGRGQSYDAAFTRHFGVHPGEAEREFVQYIRATEGRPEARLAGTVYDPRERMPEASIASGVAVPPAARS